MFINGNLETVSDDKGNTIYLKPKMDIATEARAAADLVRLGGVSQKAYELCLLRHNIVRWNGPDFTGEDGKIVPAVPANIDRLDPAEPIVALAINKIGELNTRRESPVTAEEAAANPTPAAIAT
jgi:hypothetical protein